MKFLLTALAATLAAASADAGPIRNAACKVRQRVQSRPHVRQVACDVKAVAGTVAGFPARVIEAQPVRTALGVGRTCSGGLCR